MTTINLAESQNLPFSLPAPLFRVPYTLRGSPSSSPYICRDSSTNLHLFMQNKPNLLNAQMNVSSVLTKYYENERLRRRGENKPNQTRSEFIPKGAEVPTGELLGILKPGTNF